MTSSLRGTIASLICPLLLAFTSLGQLDCVEAADFVCGPRCVHHLVHHYHHDDRTELIDLVRELQWPHLEAGTDLASLAACLDRHGIRSCPLKLASTDELTWPHPVLIHLRGDSESELGHFVVWLPTSQLEQTEVWAGAGGAQRGPWSALHKRMSGNVLLTSAVAIDDPSSALRRRTTATWLGYACLALGGVMIFGRRIRQMFCGAALCKH